MTDHMTGRVENDGEQGRGENVAPEKYLISLF